MKIYMIVILGAAIGGGLRYGLSNLLLSHSYSSYLPILIVNILGCAFMGLLSTFPLSPSWQTFLMTGILGGFTTFSSFSLEFFTLLQSSYTFAVLYLLISVGGGLLAFLIMRWVGLLW